MQSYSRNRFAAFYFIIYVLIGKPCRWVQANDRPRYKINERLFFKGIYCIMSLITAVMYHQFNGFFQDSMNSSAFRQAMGIRASFWILHEKFQEEE